MRSGEAVTQLVEFTDGRPDGDISWTLLDQVGQPITSGAVTPEAGSVSAIITVPGADNALGAGTLASPRELSWTYTVGGLVHTGRQRYRLEAFLPFGVSEDGVRNKLGVEPNELADDRIDLVNAYGYFRDTVTAEKLDAVEGRATIIACNAIEAQAALNVLPTLQVHLSAKESSGTDQFQRTAIDWSTLRAYLEGLVGAGILAVNADADPVPNLLPLIITVVRDDPVTNTTP